MIDLIKEKIKSYEKDIIKDTVRSIAFPSITADVPENVKCLNDFLNVAKDMGFKTMKTSIEDVGIVEYGAGDETIGVLVHVDVVDVGDTAKWVSEPFKAEIRDGKLYGRGAIDDKGPAVSSLYAMKALKELNVKMNKRIWLIVGTKEEDEWTDMATFLNEFDTPDYGFSPDGEFPIFNIEKGYADIYLDFDIAKNPDIENIYTCFNTINTVPSKAVIKLNGKDEVGVEGKAIHSSMPQFGDNALIKLCKEYKRFESNPFVKFINDFFTDDVYAKKLNIDDGIDTFNGEHIGLTTVAPTVVKCIDGKIELGINVRQKFGTTKKDIIDSFIAHEKEYGYKARIDNALDPIMVSADIKSIQFMHEVYKSLGYEGGFALAAGTTYAKAMPNCVSFGPIFPGETDSAHQENEYISVDTLMKATEIYAIYLYKVATSTESLK